MPRNFPKPRTTFAIQCPSSSGGSSAASASRFTPPIVDSSEYHSLIRLFVGLSIACDPLFSGRVHSRFRATQAWLAGEIYRFPGPRKTRRRPQDGLLKAIRIFPLIPASTGFLGRPLYQLTPDFGIIQVGVLRLRRRPQDRIPEEATEVTEATEGTEVTKETKVTKATEGREATKATEGSRRSLLSLKSLKGGSNG